MACKSLWVTTIESYRKTYALLVENVAGKLIKRKILVIFTM